MQYDALVAQASVSRATGDRLGAADVLRAAIAVDPDRANAWHLLGEVLGDLGDPAGAMEALRTAVGRDPDRYEAWYLLAFTAGREDRPAGIAIYGDLLARWPDDFRGWHNLACLLRDEGRGADALAAFDRARALRDDSPALWFNLGSLHHLEGRLTEARAAWERSLTLFPGFSPAVRALERLVG